jgi:hypothetical protein
MTLKIAAYVAVGLTAVAAASCGGSGSLSKQDYEKTVAAAWMHVRTEEIAFYSATGCSKRACPAVVGRLSLARLDGLPRGLREVADELSKITPPADAKSDTDKLVSGLRDIANEVGPIEQAAKSHNARAEHRALSRLQSSRGIMEIAAAFNDLKSKGYSNLG